MVIDVYEVEEAEWKSLVKMTNRHKSWDFYSCLDVGCGKKYIRPRRLSVEKGGKTILMIQSKLLQDEFKGHQYLLEEVGGVYGTGVELFSSELRVVESGIRCVLKFLSKKSNNFHMVRFYTTENDNLLNIVLKELEMEYTKIETPIIKLKGRKEKEIFDSLKSSTRRAIRQAQKRGTKVIIKTDNFSLSEIEHLISREKIGTVLFEREILSHLTNKLLEKGYLKIFLAKVAERNIAFAYVNAYGKTLGYPLGGMDRNYSYYRPSDAVQWSIIRYGLENNYENYNMVCAPPKNSNGYTITKFKMGYNPFMKQINEFNILI